MPTNAEFNRIQKQPIVVTLVNKDGQPDTTTDLFVSLSDNAPFTITPKLNDKRRFDIVAQTVGSGTVMFSALGKDDVVNVTVTQAPDQSSLLVALDGPPVAK